MKTSFIIFCLMLFYQILCVSTNELVLSFCFCSTYSVANAETDNLQISNASMAQESTSAVVSSLGHGTENSDSTQNILNQTRYTDDNVSNNGGVMTAAATPQGTESGDDSGFEEDVAIFVEKYGGGLVLALGTLGNGLSVAVLRRTALRYTPAASHLVILAISDFIFIAVGQGGRLIKNL